MGKSARRLGAVLCGKIEPSVQAVGQAADELVTTALRALYDDTVVEGMPEEFTRLLAAMPEDGAQTNGGGHATR